jgi:hypothetical protein
VSECPLESPPSRSQTPPLGRDGPISKRVQVLERIKIWSWDPKPRITLYSGSPSLVQRVVTIEVYNIKNYSAGKGQQQFNPPTDQKSWTAQLPESWDSNTWSRVLQDSKPRMAVLARISSNLPIWPTSWGSRVWSLPEPSGSKIWIWVPCDLEPRITVLGRASSNLPSSVRTVGMTPRVLTQ